MIAYSLTSFGGATHAVDKAICKLDFLYAITVDGEEVPIYTIRYDNEFKRFYKEQIQDFEDLRNCGQSDNQG